MVFDMKLGGPDPLLPLFEHENRGPRGVRGVIFDGFWHQNSSFLMVFDIKMTPFWLFFGLKIAVLGVKNDHFLGVRGVQNRGF